MPLALAVLLAVAIPAQDTARLSIETAIRLALERAPSLEAARQSLAGASGAVREARAQWYPQLAADGSLFRHEEPMVVAPIHGLNPGNLPQFDRTLVQGSLGLGWTLYDGGGRSGRMAQARALETAAAAQTENATQLLIAAAVRSYAEVLAAAEAVAAEERRREALQSESNRVGRFLREGRAAPLEQLRVNAAVASAEASRASALARAEVAEAALARLLGTTLEQTRAALLLPVRPAAGAVPSRDSLLTLARARSPELQAAAARVTAARAAIRTAGATRFPTLRLDSRLVTYGSGSGDYSTEWQSGLRLAWPVFTGGARGASVDRARAAAAEAEATLRDLELALSNRVDQAIAVLTESSRRREALEAAVGHLTEAQRVEALALEQGAGTQTDFLRAAADLAEAQAALAQARTGWIGARVELARLSGTLTPAAALAFVTTER
jgi:outer membrane protein TolC